MPTLKKLSRDALNDKALKLGITDAVQMQNRAEVIEAIEAAKAMPPGAWVLSVFGNGQRVLVEMHVDRALDEFGTQLAKAGRTEVVDATEQELAVIRKESPAVADSALAAAARRMAFEIDHPYNSATAKANCVNELHKVMDKLRELAAQDGEAKAKEGSKVVELRERRAKRRAAS